MNESFQAKEGLPPDLFPEGVPIYTGHYHKPHVVENTNIHYIGSPYQGWPASMLIACPLLCCLPRSLRHQHLEYVPLAMLEKEEVYKLLPAYNSGRLHH